jgi:hypothetical protein
MIKLEFGQPQNLDQALIRLPTRKHSLYSKDKSFEHAVHFAEHVIELKIHSELYPEEFKDIDLEERLIPLENEDVIFIEREAKSFIRKEPPILIAQWSRLDPDNMWGFYLPSGTEQSHWWKITDIEPALNITGHNFVSIEFNNQFISRDTEYRSGEHSKYEIGILTNQELDSLVLQLTRN